MATYKRQNLRIVALAVFRPTGSGGDANYSTRQIYFALRVTRELALRARHRQYAPLGATTAATSPPQPGRAEQ